MEQLSMCRICLATDVRLCTIARHLRYMYEKLTSITFQREDNRPLVACYICLARLRNCYQLRTNCLQSEELLTEMQNSGVVLVPQEVSSKSTLSVVSVVNLSLGHVLQDSTECHDIKEDSPELIHDAELDQEKIEVTEENIIKDETYGEPDVAGPSSLSADNIWPKIVNLVGKRRVLNHTRIRGGNKKLVETDTQNTKNVNKKKKLNTSKAHLKSHTRTQKEDKQYKCGKCKQCFSSQYFLTRHMNIHAGSHPYLALISKYRKDTHNRKHSDVQYKCNVCRKYFTKKDHLRDHIRTHTGENPFKCDLCKKLFARKSNLTCHIRKHIGDTPYMCIICKKSFTTKSGLVSHSRIH